MNLKATMLPGPAHDPVVRCPNCAHEIRLTESLAGPLIEQGRRRLQEQYAQKDAELARKTDELRREREQIEKAREEIDDELGRRMTEERRRMIAAESKRARDAVAVDLAAKEAEARELRDLIEAKDQKLEEAQRAHAALLRKQRELDEERRELDLTIEKRVQESVGEIRAKATEEADESARLRVMEKDRTIESMARTIEELKRKAELGSQQAKGEVLELDLEDMLRGRFPSDRIEPVGKGELGADMTQQVNGLIGRPAGTMLWETKRTRSWNDAWLAKVRDDQRRCGADVALIVSKALPRNVDQFDLLDGVWVAQPRCALPLAIALRQGLVELDGSKIAQEGQQTKTQQVYSYLTGTRFRQRVEAVIEKFSDMRDDLDRERKFMIRQWAKRETQIGTVVDATSGMIGDLQAIAGAAVPTIPNLDAQLIESSADGASED